MCPRVPNGPGVGGPAPPPPAGGRAGRGGPGLAPRRPGPAGLDAMCRMIDNGLGVGLLPDRAFALMHSVGSLSAVPLQDAWAHRELRLVARDFDALPVT